MALTLELYYRDMILQAVEDWQELNPDFLCAVEINDVRVVQNDLVLDAVLGFTPAGMWVYKDNVRKYDGEFLLCHEDTDNQEEQVYHGMLCCIQEAFEFNTEALA